MHPRRKIVAAFAAVMFAGCADRSEENRLLDQKFELQQQRATVEGWIARETNGRDPSTLPPAERDRLGGKYGPALRAIDAQLMDVNARLHTIWTQGLTPSP